MIRNDKAVIVTGSAGFAGYTLTRTLAKHGYKVYAIVRPGSEHNERLKNIDNVVMIENDLKEIGRLSEHIDESPYAMIHLAWHGKRYDLDSQRPNVVGVINALETASQLGCRRFVCTGTQAEYGALGEMQTEDKCPDPFCAYGSAKVAACYMSRYRAKDLGIDWIWGRIFSLYGTYEPRGRMLPALVDSLRKNESISLSSCRQNWDYLHVEDAAEALIALMEKGKSGEIYNIANGSFKSLKDYVEEAKVALHSESEIIYGKDPEPFVSLQPSVEKIQHDTGWIPKIPFSEGILTE